MYDLIYSYSSYSSLFIVVIILAYLLVVLLSLTIHEFAHAFAAYKFGDDTAKLAGRLTLNPFKHLDLWGSLSLLIVGFGWARPVPINPLKFRQYKKGIFWVSFAGILMNLLLAVVFSLFSYLTFFIFEQNYFYTFLHFFFNIGTSLNLALAFYNILPIYPLDGFNMLSTFTKYDNKVMNFLQKYGQLIMLILIISSAFSFALQYTVGGAAEGLYKLWDLIFRL